MGKIVALDTNLLVRILVNDEPDQARRAAKLVESNPVWVSKTVLLETEWVLRALYRIDRTTLHEALSRFLSLPTIRVEDATAVLKALAAYAGGMDFADALHLTSSGPATRFATFDRALLKKAARGESPFPRIVEP